ncbi:MAG: type II secretion system minor pseudopilin GspK [Gammaproteobacteria bacterium]|jgi:general secretion pathway protein K|nr:type II secretion system minor pseudopilin GspK [Gammaproteobacteria bacterium]MBT4493278.1 type II secretion system minor pseudopilin GspK [Gammaproteobacteria bacterium]MBT7372036.1 type II secretion system minor pseudopilin GspK [Gammaproteobacteria bacterium]
MKQQAGIALVSVLLVVAIATVMTVTMIQEQKASIQVTRGFLSRSQAFQYALGGEELARQILYEDFSLGTNIDHLTETWADPELHFEFEEGEVNLQITDLQGLINLNSLGAGSTRATMVRQRLGNIIESQGGDRAVVDRLQDWMDTDSSTRPAGAEDFDYLALDPPYRAGNNSMLDASEIVLVGVTPQQYLVLKSAISVLPDVDAGMNINTAPPIVLQSLSPSLTIEVAEAIAQKRDEQEGFEEVEGFLQLPELAGLGVAADGLGVQSSFFKVRVIARFQDRFSYLNSIIHRNLVSGEMHVIARDFSRKMLPAANIQSDDD